MITTSNNILFKQMKNKIQYTKTNKQYLKQQV
jgi:hypothetical protein